MRGVEIPRGARDDTAGGHPPAARYPPYRKTNGGILRFAQNDKSERRGDGGDPPEADGRPIPRRPSPLRLRERTTGPKGYGGPSAGGPAGCGEPALQEAAEDGEEAAGGWVDKRAGGRV